MTQNDYHPKAAFALFLNQAEHNVENALKEVTKTKEFKKSEQVEDCIKNLTSEQFYLLKRKYFKFLRLEDNSKYFEDDIKGIEKENERQTKILAIKKNILLFLFQRLDNFRNFYSHFYHKPYRCLNDNCDEDNRANIFAIAKGSDEDKYLKQFLEMRFEDAKEFYSEFIHQTPEGFKHKYASNELEHLDLKDEEKKDFKHYQFFNFNKNNNNYYFDNGESKQKRRNFKSTVFLASFFLSKRQINLFINQVKGFKRSADKQAQATREVFTHFCMKTDSDFKSENTDVRFFVDAFTHLSKIPRLAIENFKKENVKIQITYDVLNKTKNIIFIENRLVTGEDEAKEKAKIRLQEIQAKFDKLNVIENVYFEKVSELKTKIDELIKNDVEKIIGSEKYENYKDILVDFAIEDVQIRTSRDRFSEFSLQYIDDFELFKKIKFKVYSGRVFEILHEKKYHSNTTFERNYIRPEKIYSRINEIDKTQTKKDDFDLSPFYIKTKCKEVINVEIYDNAQEPQYFIRDNNVFFEVETKYGKQKGSMSIHELRNLSFAVMQNQKVEDAIIKYLEEYHELLTEILSEKNPTEIIYNIPDKELPKYLLKYLKSETANDENFKKDIINKLEYLKLENEKSELNLPKTRKYEKIRQITRFFNDFIPKYIDQSQHQELEKLLGNFPKSKDKITDFINDYHLNEGWKHNLLNIKTMFSFKSTYNNLDDILTDIYKKNIEWINSKIKKINKTEEIDKVYLEKIGKIINVTKRNYSFERIKQNIEKFLNENIVIPRGFIKKRFFGGKGLSNIIDKKATNEEACTYWDKLEDVYSIAQNATENKREKYKIAKTLNEQRLKDKVLYLMAKKYLEEKITSGKANDLKVSNEIGDILKEGIEINQKIEGKDRVLKFGINEFDRMPSILYDKRLPKILKNYLPHLDKIYLINREKYDAENSIFEPLWDLQDAFQKIDEEQLQVVDAILKKEEEILFEHLSKEAEKIGILPRYVERYINRTTIDKVLNKEEFEKYANKGRYKDNENYQYEEKLDKLILDLLTKNNHIKTETIFRKSNISFTDKNNEACSSIRHYRNAAFHNALPENGTFEDGINIIKHKRKMIEKIKLNNFKCFKETKLEFGKITLLTGANSSGKSSLIDAILSVMQTYNFPLSLDINGKYKEIGGFNQVLHNQIGDFIDIEIDFTNINRTNDVWKIKTKWQKAVNSARPALNSLNSLFIENENKIDLEISQINDFNYELKSQNFENNYTYPKDTKTDILEKSLLGNKDFPIVLLNKNFNYIDSFREEPKGQYKQASAKEKIASNGNGYTQQIAEWEETDIRKLGELTNILKKLKLVHSIKTEKRDDGTFKILIKVHKNSNFATLTNVGYGVSKILPLLVADLQLENHSLLAMSEPEIDLHPSVQADFAEYLAKQTKNNKQYLVETHSEYIINRLRLLISKGELKEEDVKVYFFENNGIETTTHSVKLKKNGQISGAPDSFFETYEVDTINIALNSFEDE